MASVRHAIVNERLQDDLLSTVGVEGKVFTIARHNFTESLEAILHLNAIGALVLDKTAGTAVINVVASSSVQIRVPVELANWFSVMQELNCLLDRGDTLFCAQSSLTGLLHEVAFETVLHLLELGNKPLGVGSEFIDQSEDLSVHLGNVATWVLHLP